MHDISWDDFRLVKAVAEARALPAAAGLLGVNHSTVFRRLGQIEATLGTRLFDRHRSGYVPTPAGEEMIALAEGFRDNVDAFTRKLAGGEIVPAGDLRVTTNDSLLIHLITPLLAGFRSAYPEIRLEVILTNQALNLSKRDADVAIRATDSPPETLVGRRVSPIAWALYGRAIDFMNPESADADLLGRDWISLSDDLASMQVVRYVQEHVAPERRVYRVNTVLGLAEAVEAGIGIAHLPCFVADTRPTLKRIGDPDDIGGIAAFLASKAASFVTGQVIVADGGVTIA